MAPAPGSGPKLWPGSAPSPDFCCCRSAFLASFSALANSAPCFFVSLISERTVLRWSTGVRRTASLAARSPVFGQGFGTRQTGFYNPLRNAPILDNQWLASLLEIGIVGVVGWAVLFTGAARRLTQSARRRAGPDGWLFAGFAAAITGFAVAMFTFDAMAYAQGTFMLWILIGLSASLLLAEQEQEQGG